MPGTVVEPGILFFSLLSSALYNSTTESPLGAEPFFSYLRN